MKVIIEDNTYIGNPQAVVNELRRQLFNRPDVTDAESYVKYIQETYRRVYDRDMALPDTDLDSRIRAMFAILEYDGLAEVLEATLISTRWHSVVLPPRWCRR